MPTIRFSTLAAAAAGAIVLITAAPASAHVTVNAPDAKQGGFTVLAFRVPTENATANTTRLDVRFPPRTPLPFVRVQPHPGWSYKVTTSRLATPVTVEGEKVTSAVSRITWTATTGAIRPGEFDEFRVSAGPLPKVATMTFKAVQTYSDGKVVRWIEAASGGAEPEFPAPMLTLAAAAASAPATPAASPAAATEQHMAMSGGDSGGTDGLTWVALAVGAAGLAVGVAALFDGRRRAVRST